MFIEKLNSKFVDMCFCFDIQFKSRQHRGILSQFRGRNACLYFVGVVLFRNKKTNCNFRKIIILVAFAQSPLLLNFLVFNQTFLFFIIITYIWYNVSLIIGLNIILNYNNYIKATLISLAPQIIFFLYILSLFQGSNGFVS